MKIWYHVSKFRFEKKSLKEIIKSDVISRKKALKGNQKKFISAKVHKSWSSEN